MLSLKTKEFKKRDSNDNPIKHVNDENIVCLQDLYYFLVQ